MIGLQQIGVIGNSIKTQILPTPSAETYGNGNRFYTLTGTQVGYTTGHTYRTLINENDEYYWKDIDDTNTNKACVGIDHAYFVQDSANVYSLYLLPIQVEGDIVADIQEDSAGNVEVIISE